MSRSRGVSPLWFGGLVALALMSAVAFVVRSTVAADDTIDSKTAAALAMYAGSNVAGAVVPAALPTYAPAAEPIVTVYPTDTPQPIPTDTPQPIPTDTPQPIPTATPEVYALPTLPPPVVVDVPRVYEVRRENGLILIWTAANQWLDCNQVWIGYGNTAGINAGNPLEPWFYSLPRDVQNIYRDICADQRRQ